MRQLKVSAGNVGVTVENLKTTHTHRLLLLQASKPSDLVVDCVTEFFQQEIDKLIDYSTALKIIKLNFIQIS